MSKKIQVVIVVAVIVTSILIADILLRSQGDVENGVSQETVKDEAPAPPGSMKAPERKQPANEGSDSKNTGYETVALRMPEKTCKELGDELFDRPAVKLDPEKLKLIEAEDDEIISTFWGVLEPYLYCESVEESNFDICRHHQYILGIQHGIAVSEDMNDLRSPPNLDAPPLHCAISIGLKTLIMHGIQNPLPRERFQVLLADFPSLVQKYMLILYDAFHATDSTLCKKIGKPYELRYICEVTSNPDMPVPGEPMGVQFYSITRAISNQMSPEEFKKVATPFVARLYDLYMGKTNICKSYHRPKWDYLCEQKFDLLNSY